MSRRKKKKWHQQQQQQRQQDPPSSSSDTLATPGSVVGTYKQQSIPVDSVTFESMEDKIRGEESLLRQEEKKEREARDVKKKLDDTEVDRRLEALRRQLGLK